MRIVYIPLDERPCNTTVVDQIVQTNKEIELIMPDKNQLGYKKTAADTDALFAWLFQLEEVDGFVLSTEMLLYGGLIPSRLHHLDDQAVDRFCERIKSLKKKHSSAQFFASSVIMRTPQYSSDDEEPDYYETYGEKIFKRRYLIDKKARNQLTNEEEKRYTQLFHAVPDACLEDYETRRQFNLSVNKVVLSLLKQDILDLLIIPQDDSAPFGYTAEDQKEVIKAIHAQDLEQKVHMYPGSDEVGATLVARLYQDHKKTKKKVYIEWSSTLGKTLLPIYEDRPFYETCKRHLRAVGAFEVSDKKEADFILYYNVPGRVLQEAWDQFEKRDITYDSYRDLNSFVDQMKRDMTTHPIVVVDAAYGNGGDYALIKRLDQEQLLGRLLSYKGWNTNANTLGTSLSQACLAKQDQQHAILRNTTYHLIDDFLYQGIVRTELTETLLKSRNLTYFDLKDEAAIVNEARDALLHKYFKTYIPNYYQTISPLSIKSSAPWNRMFEVGLEIKITSGGAL